MLHLKRPQFLTCIFTLFTLLAGFYACKSTSDSQTDIVPSAKFAPYVSAYTGGVISQTSTIRIELVQDLPAVELNAEVKDKLFDFSPSLKGKAYWINNNTIEFVPEEGALEPGAFYKVTFKLGDVIEVEKELRKLEFTFRVMERNFSMDVTSIHSPSAQTASVMGELRFSDAVDATKVERMIVAKSDGNTYPVKIEKTGNPTVFSFAINDINKAESDFVLQVEADGNALGIDNTIIRNVVIPSKDTFKFLSAGRISDPSNGMEVVFSEPVSTKQDLRGLIVIKEAGTHTYNVKDNVVQIYYEPFRRNTITLNVYAGIKSADGKELLKGTSMSFSQEAIKPEIELLTTGTIMPDSKNLLLPFKAVSLYAVDLTIVRIFESNVLSFLQTNTLSSSDELRRSGRMVYKKMLRLDGDPKKDITQWENYSVDLAGIIRQEPGAIYRIMLSFKQEYSVYPCGGEESVQVAAPASGLTKMAVAEEEFDDSKWDVPESYYNLEYEGYDWQAYDWDERDNPCHPTYYMDSDRKQACNVLASNIGLIVKRSTTNNIWVAASNILDTAPISGATVTAYNYQLQAIGSGQTDANGFADLSLKGVPFAIVASHNGQKSYLKVVDGNELSTSRFDVGGKVIKKGLKGFVYGERGVWRPGDTLHISFILEDREKRIPDKHPVSIELYNPRGQFYSKSISTNGLNGFYAFHIPTKQDDPTGLWNAYVKVGGTSFHKSLRIETVKPNRLKINLKLPGEVIKAADGSVRVDLSSNWLTGATAANLDAKVELSLSKMTTQFKNYTQYTFNNPATEYEASKTDVFEGTLDGAGNANFTMEIPESSNAPGLLRANIITRVFEPGGDASINNFSIPLSPFSAYVGVNLNQPTDKYLETDKEHIFDVVTVDPEGKAVNRSNLEYKIYRVSWSWWWEQKDESFASYINKRSSSPVKSGTLSTVNGKASIKFKIDYPSWGRYLVYVKDRDSGHAAGGTVYIDWPEWRGRSSKTDAEGISILSFTVDKDSYENGETVTAIIPKSAGGRALVTLENGSAVISHEWIQVSSKEDTKYQFKVTPEMAPNVYLHVTLLQPHAQTINDLPIRMFGVIPIFVTNKQTILQPEIKMPDVLRPEEEFAVTVSEKNGKPMTYTIAIVDDGLLDLTNFKTPDPWNEFYAREALGIRTWDIYEDVMGVYAGTYGSLFSTGGDEMLKQGDSKANRFRPVVKHLGPFSLKSGSKETHKIKLPMYVGSVRTMVVAGQGAAYGNAEKTTTVRSPLMILSSLPRVLSIGEEIQLPVNIFAMENTVKNVSVSVETSKNLQISEKQQTVTFAQTGDKLVYFKMKVGQLTGVEKVKIKASGNGQNTEETIEIDVRNPNPMATYQNSKLIGAGETGDLSYQLGNNSQDNWVKMEISRIPPVDISRRFDYLYNYEHYCSEQLTSRALPLLFVSQFKDVNKTEQETLNKNIQEAIKNLYGRQLSNGGIVYWPGYASADEWITSYAGQFLVMANEKGYEVNSSVLNKWKSFQRSAALNWSAQSKESGWYYWQNDLIQAYRLYTLALAGAPELGAMNRMKEQKDLSQQAKWRLAAAYALAGKESAANEIVFGVKVEVDPYQSNNSVYGSYDRDEAMILETLIYLKKDKEAFVQAQRLSKHLTKQNYFSTQSTAFALMAMGRLAEKMSGALEFNWTLNGQKQNTVNTGKAVFQSDLPLLPLQGKVTVENKGKGTIYADLIARTRLMNDTLPEIANNLKIEVKYTDLSGKAISETKLKQGTDFIAVVTVSNISGTTNYRDIALTHIIPTGWEIYNQRMENVDEEAPNSGSSFDYQDIRDDRVLTYFSLNRGAAKIFPVRLQATYAGSFTLPAVQCEAMYDVTVQARTKAGRVTVEK